MKLYNVKSSAHRAAKQAGLDKGQYEIVEMNGQFGFESATAIAEMEKQAEAQFVANLNEDVAKALAENIKRRSDVEKPTKLVWHIAEEMKGARRRDVIAECLRYGIAYYTARTQYQLWFKATYNSTKS